jgi:hypothetical protein
VSDRPIDAPPFTAPGAVCASSIEGHNKSSNGQSATPSAPLRWLLIQVGLPRPEVQTNLRDAEDRFVGRADLYYPAARLVLEYDGGNHRDRLVEDDRRQNLLINAGFRLLRFTAADIHNRPDVVVAQVQGALAQRTSKRTVGAKRA